MSSFSVGRRLHLVLPLLSVSVACADGRGGRDSRALPYRWEVVREFGTPVLPADLNGDGTDELIELDLLELHPRERRYSAVRLLTGEGKATSQLNYEGVVLPPHVRDVDGDSIAEVLVPVLRGDSLFVSISNARGEHWSSFLLVVGKPRVEADARLPWDPRVLDFYVVDTNADGKAELVTIVNTDFARLPRGVLVHSLPDGRPLGQAIVGGSLTQAILDDFDGDGLSEIVAGTAAVNNGAEAGGFDDRHSHLLVFRLNPVVRVGWSRLMGGRGTGVLVSYADFDGDGRREIFASLADGSRGEGARMELIDPRTWQTFRQRSFNERLVSTAVADLDGDARAEIVAIRAPGDLWVLDGTSTSYGGAPWRAICLMSKQSLISTATGFGTS